MALRSKTLQEINLFFDKIFGMQIVFACSCGVGMVNSKDVEKLLNSQYYCQREGYGRMFDSDVLGNQGNLFMADSIDLVPKELLTKLFD